MADLAPIQILKRRPRRSRAPAMASEAPFSGPAPSPGFVTPGFVTPGFVTPWSGGWRRWFERRGIEMGALFGWVGNGR